MFNKNLIAHNKILIIFFQEQNKNNIKNNNLIFFQAIFQIFVLLNSYNNLNNY